MLLADRTGRRSTAPDADGAADGRSVLGVDVRAGDAVFGTLYLASKRCGELAKKARDGKIAVTRPECVRPGRKS